MSDDQGLAFVIDGREYPSPELDSLNMGERRVMYDLCGIVQEDFAPQDGESEDDYDSRVKTLTRHPGFMEALMQIAYQRGNPAAKPDKVKAVIANTNYLEALEKWAEDTDDEESPSPLASTTEPKPASSSGPVESSERSGQDSTNGSDEQDSAPKPIGTTRSDTSPMLARETSN